MIQGIAFQSSRQIDFVINLVTNRVCSMNSNSLDWKVTKKKKNQGLSTVYPGNICVMPNKQLAFLSGSLYLILIHACSNIHKQF